MAATSMLIALVIEKCDHQGETRLISSIENDITIDELAAKYHAPINGYQHVVSGSVCLFWF